MAQIIDIKFQEKAKSQPLNKRFMDITGPSVLTGFRLQKGSLPFSLSLIRGGFNSSIAISPSGAKVEETSDLIDRIAVQPNTSTSGLPRVDSVYLTYQYGNYETAASYEVVQGGEIPAPNPNVSSHLLLGYVYVYPSSQALRTADLVSTPYGFNRLEISGSSFFHGPVEFDKEVVFKGKVSFTEGGTGGGTNPATLIERLPMPIVAATGQRDFNLPSAYTMNTHTLFVYKDRELQPPSEWSELSNTSFRFHDPLEGGEEIWAFWYKGVSVFSPATHNHDDLYYRKWEIANRSVRYMTDYLMGPSGRILKHYLGTEDYIVISVLPTEKSSDVGVISVEKRMDEIIVYNTGAYRGKFDLTYIVKSPNENITNNDQSKDFSVDASLFDNASQLYTVSTYKRKDGTIYMVSTLLSKNANGKYTRVQLQYYNTAGTRVIDTKLWALTYDGSGKIISKVPVANTRE